MPYQGRGKAERPLKSEFGGFMAKQKRKCQDCEICVTADGLTRCLFGGGAGSVVFPDNTACKMFVPAQKRAEAKREEPQPGTAPFCGEYAKCNNAEGCDACREFEIWLSDREK